MKTKNVMLVVECGCYAEVSDADVNGMSAVCPECKEVANVSEWCRECSEQECECEENENWLSEMKAMEHLYRGEVTAGVHVPENQREEMENSLR